MKVDFSSRERRRLAGRRRGWRNRGKTKTGHAGGTPALPGRKIQFLRLKNSIGETFSKK